MAVTLCSVGNPLLMLLPCIHMLFALMQLVCNLELQFGDQAANAPVLRLILQLGCYGSEQQGEQSQDAADDVMRDSSAVPSSSPKSPKDKAAKAGLGPVPRQQSQC